MRAAFKHLMPGGRGLGELYDSGSASAHKQVIFTLFTLSARNNYETKVSGRDARTAEAPSHRYTDSASSDYIITITTMHALRAAVRW